MKVCVKCEEELGGEINGEFSITHYCRNEKCDRWGLVTLVCGEKNESNTPKSN